MQNLQKTMDKIVTLCKGRGFIYSGSEIYGGLSNTWDYGPLGVELKNNIKKAWMKKFVQQCPYNVGLDSAILMNTKTWEASGHLAGFSDPLMDCKSCRTRHRADTLIEQQTGQEPAGASFEEMEALIREKGIQCPNCGKSDFTNIRSFNLMFKTFQGVTDGKQDELYLRPETAQGIFVNFKNVQRTTRKKVPFGIAQVGKSFRNEITPGNFIFRTREFEQMELEFFCKPGTEIEWFGYWKDYCVNWLTSLGIQKDSISVRDHEQKELSHYSNATSDIEFVFPFGLKELWGIASRTNFDLTAHQTVSGENLEYFDQEANEKYLPYVIEPSLGVERVLLAFLVDAYDEEEVAEGDVRTVLRLHPALAPYKCCVLPLSKKLSDKGQEIWAQLSQDFMCDFDEAGSIGKRYRRQDEIGTPFCITVDFETVGDDKTPADNCVTVRERDSMNQVRIPISELNAYIAGKLQF